MRWSQNMLMNQILEAISWRWSRCQGHGVCTGRWRHLAHSLIFQAAADINVHLDIPFVANLIYDSLPVVLKAVASWWWLSKWAVNGSSRKVPKEDTRSDPRDQQAPSTCFQRNSHRFNVPLCNLSILTSSKANAEFQCIE